MTKLKTCADPQGHLFSISQARYIAPYSTTDFILSSIPDFSLAAVFNLPQGEKPTVTSDWMRELVEKYNSCDDVFDKAFLEIVVFAGAREYDVEFTDEAQQYLRELGNQQVVFVSSPGLLPGPYALVGGELRDVWKLVDDSNGTCMATLKPQSNPSDRFQSFQLRSSDDQFLTFALRSRIKTQASYKSPLAGLRIVIKDNIHLKGIKTSVGNRAFYDTYPPRKESAQCIQKLLDRGVVVVGKAKMNSFGNWEEPTEYIDYQAPWNPRGDRYQSTGGSSSGSASAIAAYDWLDIAIGTDTWGSVTRPALWCGCFGLRPSVGTVSGDGVEPYVTSWDIPGILARDLQRCRDFAAEWLACDTLEKDPKPYSSILWPTDFWSIIDPKQTEIAQKFTKTIESSLGVKCEEVSFEAIWAKSPPAEANGLLLPQFINPATAALAYDVYHNGEDFRARYWKKFNHAPYTSPPNRELWSIGKTISKEDRDKGFDDINVYRKWFQNTVLAGKNSNALTILPLESMAPRYRDRPPTFKRPPQDGINALALAPVMKTPILTVPIAEIPYYSEITECEEMLPFSIAIMATAGTDLALMDAVQQVLEKAGLPAIIKSGKVMY